MPGTLTESSIGHNSCLWDITASCDVVLLRVDTQQRRLSLLISLPRTCVLASAEDVQQAVGQSICVYALCTVASTGGRQGHTSQARLACDLWL